MYGEKVFKQVDDVSLSIKNAQDDGFVFALQTGPKSTVIEESRVIYGDFALNKNKYYVAYVIFNGEINILRLAAVPEKGGIPEYLETYVGSFYAPKIVFHQGEQLIFAHMYTDKSKLVCIRRGVCYDVSAGGSNHLTGLVDMGECLVAAIDCDHYLKQEEKINGGVMPFDAFGIQIMRKPALLVYHLNTGEGGGLLKADADAFLVGGSQLVQLARKGKRFYGAYMRFENNTYVIYVTDFGDAWQVVDTCRIVRDFKYKIKNGEHVFEYAGGTITKPVEGGVDINLAPGKPCAPIRLDKIAKFNQSSSNSGFGYYWGDLRVRTNVSICSNNAGWHCGPLNDKYMALRQLNKWDFVAISDHDAHIDKETWENMRLNNDLYNIDHKFTVLNAYEWGQGKGAQNKAGHYNVVFRGRGDVMRGLSKDADTPAKLAEKLQNPMREGMMIAAHPSDIDFYVDWRQTPDTVVLTEIFGARGSYEAMDCPHHPFEYNRKVEPKGCVVEGLTMMPLGFVGGGGHEGIGATCVIANSLTREDIFDALAERHCYATTGARIIIEYSINGAPMGSIITPTVNMQVQVIVQGTNEIVEALVITDKETIPLVFKGNRVNQNFKIQPRFMYAYVRVLQKDNEAAWSSPIFVA